MFSTRFLCQHCQQPLKLRQSSGTVCSAQEEPGGTEADSGSSTEPEASGGPPAGAPSSPREPTDGRMMQPSAAHFTLVGRFPSKKTLGHIQKTHAHIFDVISDLEGVDRALCTECTDCLLEQLDRQLAQAQLDCQTYRRCLELGPQGSEAEGAALQSELWGLMLEEARLVRELGNLDRSHAKHVRDLRALQWQQQELSDQLSSLGNQLSYAQLQTRALRATDIFKATFEISEDGPLGVINGFRLGRLPGVPVGWGEINAAWGQAALLLLALSKAVGLQFQRYRLVACGSRSYLKSLTGDGEELPLASEGRDNVFLDNKFDRAMLAFLDCLQQFQQEAGRSGLRVPYTVHAQGGLLGDGVGPTGPYSVRTHLNTEEQWTAALRRMLSNLKSCLAWASQRYCPK
ncbi:Beclin-1-like protein 1 [Heterocephalus glaber]|uniref:Beclin-1-like protein 1 n=1 Tax=Heterocephalus glaber TaxID=10181 RepID=G5B393_HETGA|nr:Beclin-1-like protein 1 [Heterocephalus glaber]